MGWLGWLDYDHMTGTSVFVFNWVSWFSSAWSLHVMSGGCLIAWWSPSSWTSYRVVGLSQAKVEVVRPLKVCVPMDEKNNS